MTATAERAMVYRIFNEALDVATQSREQFVRERCAQNPRLCDEVSALLAVAKKDPDATGLLLRRESAPVRDLIGRQYGRFRLVELIGVGGMGLVYRAERVEGVPQLVAIKLLSGSITGASGVRFVSEAKLLARIEHPAIARLIDVGVQDGEAWMALELVVGQPIDQYCDSHELSLRQRIKLISTVTDAVATAHRMLVVHRDIKPNNVLVTADGRPKLIDFGIAATLNLPSEAPDPADVHQLFTPNYASPEQVLGDPITAATDVFGLGALAYRLLCGEPPFARISSPIGYLLAVTQQDVDRPSQAAAAAGMSADWVRALQGDLDAILFKALKRDRSQRYASAQELLADWHRYLDAVPVSARAPTWGYRLSKLVYRRLRRVSSPVRRVEHKGARWLAVAGALALALTVGGTGGAMLWKKFSGAAQPAANSTHTVYDDDKSARDLYLNANFELSTRSPDGLLAAQQAFRSLTVRYPQRAAAWSGLADSYLLMREFGTMSDNDAFPAAEKVARTALQLDPKLTGAWLDEGFVAYWWDFDPARAFAAFDTAIQLDPGSARAYQWYANTLAASGDFARALPMISHARELDPANRAIIADDCWARFSAGQRTDAIACLERMERVDPRFVSWHGYLWRAYLVLGRNEDAMREAAETADLRGNQIGKERANVALARLHSGGPQAMLNQLAADAAQDWAQGRGSAVDVAGYLALAGDRAGALSWLTKAKHEIAQMVSIPGNANFQAYQDDPGFMAAESRRLALIARK